MSARQNEQLVREYFQEIRADYYAEDAELRDMSAPAPLCGREAVHRFLRLYLGDAFPDGRYQLHHLVADERSAAAERTFRGTNTGPLMGTAPTGRRVEFSGVSMYEIRGGVSSSAPASTTIPERWPTSSASPAAGFPRRCGPGESSGGTRSSEPTAVVRLPDSRQLARRA